MPHFVNDTDERRTGIVRRFLVAAPDLVLALFIAACLAVTIAVVLEDFTPWLVGLAFVICVPILMRLLPPLPEGGTAQVVGAVASLLVPTVWVVLNARYVAQLLWVTRDPAIYTVSAIWLTHHRTAGIDTHATLDLQAQVHGLSASLLPFSAGDASGVVHGQGGLTLPALMAVGGWLDGLDGVLRTNLLIGAVALVGMYAVARRFMRPWLALVAQAALGLAVAFLYLMRAPYSEGIMTISAMAGLIWLVTALRSGRPALAAAGGVFLGVGSMARIDGPVVLVGAAVLAVIVLSAAPLTDFAVTRRLMLTFLGAGFLSSVAGLGSLWISQRRYVHDLRGQAVQLWAGTLCCLVLVGAVLTVRAVARRRGWSGGVGEVWRRRVGVAAGVGVPLAFLFWWSRPLWWQAHFTPAGSVYASVIETWQQQAGLTVDGTRSYDELTLHWVVWYFGWSTVALAAVGLGIMFTRGITARRLDLLAVVVPAAVVATLYFDKVSITPDQPWAYRRLLPVITPGLLVGAAFAIEWWLSRTRPAWQRYGVGGVAAVLVVGGPILSWSSLLTMPEGVGTRAAVEKLCRGLTADVVLVATGHEPANLPVTVRTVCGREVVSGDATDVNLLRELQARAGRVQVVAFSSRDLPQGTELGDPNVRQTLRFWKHGLAELPQGYAQTTWRIWIGHLEHGRVLQDPAPDSVP
ncbi:hypothetical protein [Nocardioides sp. Kera G14]|uniref:hypothetical protein n=1 Tax=Nocardioides sp. Kera G14 TaxID=2884264 RepID=UPI001D0FB8E5|nr:hypothetical protein [Nocardioides sp. Kera G14]UDY22672.1 hypothetical protein LH076_11385 [Nocardioides sp. Kera G14]